MKLINVEYNDIVCLLSYMWGYIDDELGGMAGNSEHTKKFYELLNKYDIFINDVYKDMV
jgi:hypothetical protein